MKEHLLCALQVERRLREGGQLPEITQHRVVAQVTKAHSSPGGFMFRATPRVSPGSDTFDDPP